MEYLDACFPYIKEAAINEDGDVWMLPVYIDVPCLIYNERLCGENSIDFSKPMDYAGFIEMLLEKKRDSKTNDLISISGYFLNQIALHQYLRDYDSFESTLFEDYAVRMKDLIDYERKADDWFANNNYYLDIFSGNNYEFLFFGLRDYDLQLELHSDEVRASQLPILTGNDSSVAICTFLCVNPASKQLDDTLDYISSLCEYIMEYSYEKTMLFKDRSLYPDNSYYDDLYGIYSNADIRFTSPSDLYYNDYLKYLDDELSLEEFIRLANRKLDIYRNE